MVNLLFISNHPRMVVLKNALQPLLKVKIDIVGDFDFGLKEVFEKRPTLVFIQDQIAGVTGESVARHIQMLLGSSAPAFVFMHDGNPKVTAVKGLYEHLIDLSQSDSEVLSKIRSILKSLLGPEWIKILVPSRPKTTNAKAVSALPEEHRVIADQLVEDFISDLGNDKPLLSTPVCPVTQKNNTPDLSLEEPFDVVFSHQDQLADIISETAKVPEKIEPVTIAAPAEKVEQRCYLPETPVHPAHIDPLVALVTNELQPDVAASVRSADSPGDSLSVGQASPSSPNSPAFKLPDAPPKLRLTPISPAEFRIKKEHDAEEVADKDSLRPIQNVFLESTKKNKSTQAVYVFLFVSLLVATGTWLYQKQHLVQPTAKQSNSTNVTPPTVTQPVPVIPGPPKPDTTEPVTGMVSLPGFIPRSGHDKSYAVQNQGWERYVGPDTEFRVFFSGGKLKAVQVLALPGQIIDEPMLKTVLTELAGTGEYKVLSTEQKYGYQVSRANVGGKTEMLIYRKKTTTHAFVVSLAE